MNYAQAIFEMYERGRGEPRTYLGGSIIGYGLKCRRQLWYRMRGVGNDMDGRTLRLLDHGNSEEDRLIRDLRKAGIQVSGEQLRATAFDGRMKLHIDGLIADGGKVRILEVKTSNAKRYKPLVEAFRGARLGVHQKALDSWQVHHAQMQVAMGLLGFDEAVYAIVCKDNDELHFELVPFNEGMFLELMDIAKNVLDHGNEMPPRAVKLPDQFGVCQWCPGYDDCWQQEISFNW